MCTAPFFYIYYCVFGYVELVLKSTRVAAFSFRVYDFVGIVWFLHLMVFCWLWTGMNVLLMWLGLGSGLFQGMMASFWAHGFSWFLFGSCWTFGIFLWVCFMLSGATALTLIFWNAAKPFYIVFIFTFLFGFVWLVLVFWLLFSRVLIFLVWWGFLGSVDSTYAGSERKAAEKVRDLEEQHKL